MTRYRCYLFDRNSHILRAEILDWADDAGASGWAERFAGDAAAAAYVELWERDRLIGRFGRHSALPAVASSPF